MKKYNISKPKKYTKDGVEKTFWQNIGTMTEFEKKDGTISRIIEIPAIGLEANVFVAEPKVDKPKRNISKLEPHESTADEDVDTENIPF